MEIPETKRFHSRRVWNGYNIELVDLVYCLFSRKLGLKIDTFLTLMGTRPIWVNHTLGWWTLDTTTVPSLPESKLCEKKRGKKRNEVILATTLSWLKNDSYPFYVHSSTALVAASEEEEREMQEGKIGFTFNKANGRFIFLKRRPRGKKPNFVKAGFHLELHSLKQQNGRGRDIGRSINSFASQRFHILSFNRTASFQGKFEFWII